MSPKPFPPSTPPSQSVSTAPYPTPPATGHRVSHESNETDLPQLIYDADIPDAPWFEPYTYTVRARSPLSMHNQRLDSAATKRVNSEEDLVIKKYIEESATTDREEGDGLLRLLKWADGITVVTKANRVSGQLRPSTDLSHVWWLVIGRTAPLRTRSSSTDTLDSPEHTSRQPLFLHDSTEGPVIPHPNISRVGCGALVTASQTTKRKFGDVDDEIVFVRSSPRTSKQASGKSHTHFGCSPKHLALEEFFDERIDLGTGSGQRHGGERRLDEMLEDFEITGTSSKRRRLETDEAVIDLARSASNSPLKEVEAERCGKCGCTCAGAGAEADRGAEATGVRKKGQWGGLPRNVLSNILGERLD